MDKTPAIDTTSNYLVVVPVPVFRVDERRCWIESAFAGHLRLLLESLAPRFRTLTIGAPEMDAATFEALEPGLAELDFGRDRVRFLALRNASAGRRESLTGAPRIFAKLWRAAGESAAVHAGPSPLFAPMENLALAAAWLRRRQRVFVVDIDWRESARMNLATGFWSFGEYWRTRYLHDTWLGFQTWLARWTCDVVMLKGRKLVADYGRGAPNVHWILDAAHSASMLLDTSELERKRADLATPGRPLRCLYFGRLTAYKGVSFLLKAVARARERGANVTFDVFGIGEELDALRSETKTAGLDAAITFHGARPYGLDFLRELTNYDLLLAAPLSEDTPRSALDAQARGIAILAFDTYYYRELEQLSAGVVCTPWRDLEAFAAKLVDFAAHRETLAPLADRSVAFARDNTQEAWLERRAKWTLGGR